MAESSRVNLLRKYINEYANGTQRRFGEMVGIMPANLSQMLSGSRPITDKMWDRIHQRLGIELVEIEEGRGVPALGNEEKTEGELLRQWMEQYRITQRELADRLGVSSVQVNHYLKTARFKGDTLKNILKAVGVTENDLFKKGVSESETARYLPLIKFYQREGVDLQGLTRVDVGKNYKENAVVIEIGNDYLQPPYTLGWRLIATEIPAEKWRYTTGLVVVMVLDEIMIRRIHKNNLATEKYLELRSDDPDGPSITVLEKDINRMWRMETIIKGDVR